LQQWGGAALARLCCAGHRVAAVFASTPPAG